MKVVRNIVFIPFGLIIGLTVDGFEQPRHAGIADGDVEYETPANKDGMGTLFGLVKNADPIRGLARVYEPKDGKGEAPSVLLLDVRMPPRHGSPRSNDHGKHGAALSPIRDALVLVGRLRT